MLYFLTVVAIDLLLFLRYLSLLHSLLLLVLFLYLLWHLIVLLTLLPYRLLCWTDLFLLLSWTLLLSHHPLFHLFFFCWRLWIAVIKLNWLFVIVLVGVDVCCISLIGTSCLHSSFLDIIMMGLFIVVVCWIIICFIVSLVFALSFANALTILPSVSTIRDTFVIIVFAESSGDKFDITVLSSAWFVAVFCCYCASGDCGHCCCVALLWGSSRSLRLFQNMPRRFAIPRDSPKFFKNSLKY
jgi:hypothetical protein